MKETIELRRGSLHPFIHYYTLQAQSLVTTAKASIAKDLAEKDILLAVAQIIYLRLVQRSYLFISPPYIKLTSNR
jgi:hypothetical protein